MYKYLYFFVDKEATYCRELYGVNDLRDKTTNTYNYYIRLRVLSLIKRFAISNEPQYCITGNDLSCIRLILWLIIYNAGSVVKEVTK